MECRMWRCKAEDMLPFSTTYSCALALRLPHEDAIAGSKRSADLQPLAPKRRCTQRPAAWANPSPIEPWLKPAYHALAIPNPSPLFKIFHRFGQFCSIVVFSARFDTAEK